MPAKYLFTQPAFDYVVAVEKTRLGFIYLLFGDGRTIQSKDVFKNEDEAIAKGLEAAESEHQRDLGFQSCLRGQKPPITASHDWLQGWGDAVIGGVVKAGVEVAGVHLMSLSMIRQFHRMDSGEEFFLEKVLADFLNLVQAGYSNSQILDLVKETYEEFKKELAIACGEAS